MHPPHTELDFSLKQAFGPLLALLSDPAVTDIFVNGSAGVWVDRGSGAVRVEGIEMDARVQRKIAVDLIAAGGRHLDEMNPCVDVRLVGGIRVHAVLEPISTEGSLISVRIPRARHRSFVSLVSSGLCDEVTAKWLLALVRSRKNVLISGPTGSGKTTLLAAMMGTVSSNERILTVEDVAELQIDHPHVIGLEARQSNIEGVGEITIERLVRESLRMRPDRIVLGECRGPELRILLSALNTGHDGGAGTVHASSLADVPARLEALGASAGMSTDELARQAVSAIDAVVALKQHGTGREIEAVGRLGLGSNGSLVAHELTVEKLSFEDYGLRREH